MRRIFEYCVGRPKPVLLGAAVVTALSLPGLTRLRLQTDGHALVPVGDARVVEDAEVRKSFGVKDLIAVTITTNRESIFNPATMRLVRDLSRAFANIEGVEPADVMSLATEKRDRVRPGSLTFRTFLEPFPSTTGEFELLRADLRAIGLLHGTLVSYDEKTAAVLVGVSAGQNRVRIYDDILALIDDHDLGGHTLRTVGAPVAESQLGLHILEDLTLLVPIVIAVMSVLIFWLTRTVWAVAVGMCEVGTTLMVTFGLMGYVGVPVYLTTAILPVTLTSMAIADDIHIFGHYLLALTRKSDPRPHGELIVATMTDIYRPIVMTSLTTGVAFLSFTASPIWPVQTFGMFQCFGVMVAMVWSLSVTPAALALMDTHRLRAITTPRDLAPRLARLGQSIVHSKRTWLAMTVMCVILAPFGVAQIFVQDSWIDGFSESSTFFKDTAFVDTNFHGTHVLMVTVAADSDGGLLTKERLERVGALEQHIAGLVGVGGVLGPYSQLTTMFYLFKGRNEVARQIPNSSEAIRELIRYMERVRGQRRTHEIITRAGDRGLVTVFLKRANFIDTERIMAAIDEFEERELPGSGIKLGFAGDVSVSQATIPAIVSSQLNSLLLTLAGIWLVATTMTRSPSQGLCCMLPAAIASLLVLAFMGAVGMPLGVATSMFCAITLGVGVDYSIHFTSRCQRLVAAGHQIEQAIAATMASSGLTISIDALAVGAGFALLAASSVPANRHLGCLIALSVGLCYVITMLGLPALLAVWRTPLVGRN